MKKLVSLLILLAVVCAPAVAFADPSPWTAENTYSQKSVEKFKFGFKNLFFGAADLVQEPYWAIKKDENVWAGFGKGIIDAGANVFGGAVHLVTFFIPLDLPLPEGGVHSA